RSPERRPLTPLFNTPASLLDLLSNCSTCGTVFSSRNAGVQHQRKTHNLKYCPVCFRLLSCKGNTWKDHLIKNHAVAKGVEAARCPFSASCPSTTPFNFDGIYIHIGKQHLVPE